MNDNRDRTTNHSFLRRAALTPAVALLALLIVIWAAAGGGYFWPMWPALGAAMAAGFWFAMRWGWSQPKGAGRWFAIHAGASAVLAISCVVIWAITHGGYFWPIWSFIGLGALVGLHRAVLRPGQRSLELRVDELKRTRTGVLDVQASQLRRIERDLHDGAQARLVALSMQLGRAEERLSDRPETAALVRQAREEATAAIAELRDLARGIAPPVLADRGLEAAVRSLATRSTTTVEVTADLPVRLPPVVEAAAYFVVAESLTNVVKHTPGASARVTLNQDGGMLVVEVIDDGPGGADRSGGGLTGLKQRVEALDGRLEVHSVAGEGTVVWAVLPCE